MSFELKPGKKIAKYTLINRIGEGGFGQVWLAKESRHSLVKVAIKIYCEDAHDEAAQKAKDRIRYEARALSELAKVTTSVPRFYGAGEIAGNPYYLMENLVELMGDGYRGLPQYDDRCGDESVLPFVKSLLLAVKSIHEAGWVHCDLKPSNLMQRGDAPSPVIVDFGSAHVAEHEVRASSETTISIMQDGSRMLPFTPGYADPVEELHTIHGDVYAIGQILRDLFREDVPLVWGKIINKCLSRNLQYRYPHVDAIIADVENIEDLGREEMRKRISNDLLDEVKLQSCLVDKKPTRTTWRKLELFLVERQSSPVKPVVFADHELFVDFGVLPSQNISVGGRVTLKNERFVVFKGPGVFKVNMDALITKTFPKDAVVFLWNNVTLVNTSRKKLKDGHIRYLVGGSCYLNFPNASKNFSIDPEYVHQSNVGYAFVRGGGPATVAELIGSLNATTSEFLQHAVFTEDFGEMANFPCSGDKISRYLLINGIVEREMGVFPEFAATGRKKLQLIMDKDHEEYLKIMDGRFVR
ncbi:MAG: protein kinase [bacterium]